MLPANSIDLIADAYRRGITLEDIGAVAGVSRERIRQLLAKHGVDRSEGGSRVRHIANLAANSKRLIARRNAKAQRFYGCSYQEVVNLNGGRGFSDGPAYAYKRQRCSAASRGIGWKLTFPEWMRIWNDSGKFELRGRGKNAYCMARKNDVGPYAPDNVEIVTTAKNVSDSYKTKPAYLRIGLKDPNELSPRQKQVQEMLGTGMSPKEIATKLGCSVLTVKQHRNNVSRKTGAFDIKYAKAA